MFLSGHLSALWTGKDFTKRISRSPRGSSRPATKGCGKYALAALPFLLSQTDPCEAGIKGSKHDFSDTGWAGGQICIVCHTPHNGATQVVGPLWNHAISSQTYLVYDSPTITRKPEQPQPGSISRLCLSCHDGTIALDSFGGKTGATTMDPESTAMLGADLRNDHPIGIAWNHDAPATSPNVAKNECIVCHDNFLPTKATAGKELKFFNGKVECASCHDVHNSRVMDVKLLRKPLQNSQLCQHCHFK